MKKIFFCCNSFHGFCNFRYDIAQYLSCCFDEIIIVAPIEKNEKVNVKFSNKYRIVDFPLASDARGVFREVNSIIFLTKLLWKERPDLVVSYTIKPNIYSVFATRLFKTPQIRVVPGLGRVFKYNTIFNRLLIRLYRLSLRGSICNIVLNSEDYTILSKLEPKLKEEHKIELFSCGEGINLARFPYTPGTFHHPHFLFVGRLLWEKGYKEYVEAAKIIRNEYPNIDFLVAGTIQTNGIPLQTILADEESGIINFIGYQENIFEVLSDSNTIVVVPSYYKEGLNRVLLEACSVGRPIITTSLPGLRECVVDSLNGFVVSPCSVNELATAMKKILELPPSRLKEMGANGRKYVEQNFNIKMVIKKYINILKNNAIL